MLSKILFVCTLAFLLCACGASEQPEAAKQKTSLEKTLEPQLDALEKAKGVEDALQKSVEERDKKMRENGI